MRQRGALGFADVFEQGSCGGDGGRVIDVETFERLRAEVFVEQTFGFLRERSTSRAESSEQVIPVPADALADGPPARRFRG